ncbi:von Willebrand factor A domain-containing protein 5A-like isoform X2 [Gopherus flavomarginatus]|uniref:von Willebrand factor A domain-containing protein 5A-like isoform X2 n=1 Tax=Gopherus flavomarginatus TaxID=286002 RepID=UPI0021CC2CA5|nr:von Willebrand factor A domain-containing protein 5A-like isoform X2 [Gopherus flavomarginatus]
MSCGLLNSSNEPVPLRSGSVTVLIRGFVADVSCELLYRNEEQGPVEAMFVFPVDPEAAVYAFEARLGSTCIQAQLREKQQAQQLYGDALAGGQSSFLLQQEGTKGDVFSCSLGNLPPGEEAALTLRYVCELPLEPDGAARYMLPAVLRPRYTPHGETHRYSCHISLPGETHSPQHRHCTPYRWDGEDVTQGVPRVPQGELPYTLSLSATLQSPHGIDRVLSNCSLTPLSYTSGNRTSAQVSLAEAPPWDRDVELLVYYAEPHKPSAMLEIGLPGAEPGDPGPALKEFAPGLLFQHLQLWVSVRVLLPAERGIHPTDHGQVPAARPAAPGRSGGHRDLGAATSHLPQPLPGRAPAPAVCVHGRGGGEHPGGHH